MRTSLMENLIFDGMTSEIRAEDIKRQTPESYETSALNLALERMFPGYNAFISEHLIIKDPAGYSLHEIPISDSLSTWIDRFDNNKSVDPILLCVSSRKVGNSEWILGIKEIPKGFTSDNSEANHEIARQIIERRWHYCKWHIIAKNLNISEHDLRKIRLSSEYEDQVWAYYGRSPFCFNRHPLYKDVIMGLRMFFGIPERLAVSRQSFRQRLDTRRLQTSCRQIASTSKKVGPNSNLF